jgi:hypothetical protein
MALCAGALALAPALPACGGTIVPTNLALKTPDVQIKGDTFTIEPNGPAAVPFVLGAWRKGTHGDDDMPNAYREWLGRGAQRVQVYTKDRGDKPLYGVISFHQLPKSAKGPALHAFTVVVPQNYIDDAAKGNVSVVFEPVDLREPGKAVYAWVLWLSDQPFGNQ